MYIRTCLERYITLYTEMIHKGQVPSEIEELGVLNMPCIYSYRQCHPFLYRLKNRFNAVLWCCLQIKGASHKNGDIVGTCKRG